MPWHGLDALQGTRAKPGNHLVLYIWKGAKAREIGEGYKMFYHGYNTKKNGVPIVVGEKWRDNILEVNRISDRLITAKLLIDTININIVSAYAPQVGCTPKEKEEFWEEVEELIRSFSEKDNIVIGADLNGHILLLLYVTRYFCSTTRLTMLRQ